YQVGRPVFAVRTLGKLAGRVFLCILATNSYVKILKVPFPSLCNVLRILPDVERFL
ncbi:hypothetical protein CRM22_006714, partial [Opisthorchis felineus]